MCNGVSWKYNKEMEMNICSHDVKLYGVISYDMILMFLTAYFNYFYYNIQSNIEKSLIPISEFTIKINLQQ